MKPKILIIDDEIHIVELIKFNLENSGYEVDVSYDGLDGYLKIKQDKPNLVLLDWMLPNISGIDMLKKIATFFPSLSAEYVAMFIPREVLPPPGRAASNIRSDFCNPLVILSRPYIPVLTPLTAPLFFSSSINLSKIILTTGAVSESGTLSFFSLNAYPYKGKHVLLGSPFFAL